MTRLNLTTTRVLTPAEFEEFARPELEKVCTGLGDDVLQTPFINGRLPRLILHEYWLPGGAFARGLQEGSLAYKDEGFFVSVLGYRRELADVQPFHWYVKFADLGDFVREFPPLEHVMYSPSGMWAIAVDVENYGLFMSRTDKGCRYFQRDGR